MIFEEFKPTYDKANSGYFKPLQTGLPKMEEYINGIQKRRMDVLFGDTGSGKTSMALYNFVLKPLIENLNSLQVVYFTFGFSKDVITAKLMSALIYAKANKVVEVSTILNMKKERGKITDNLILTSGAYLDKLPITIIETMMTPSQCKSVIDTHATKHGKFVDVNGTRRYKETDDTKMTLVVFDTANNLLREGFSQKETIDLHTRYCLETYKNLYNYNVLNIVYATNRITDTTKFKAEDLAPKKQDLTGYESLLESSDLIMSLYDPLPYLTETRFSYRGYDLSKTLKLRFRVLTVLKNRFAFSNKSVYLSFIAETCSFTELPTAPEMKESDYILYSKPYK
jgi:replicative DNA helicase